MTLHVDHLGSGPALALVHGFTQTGRCWGVIAEDLCRDHRVALVDAPGHGRSARLVANLPAGAVLLSEAVGRAIYLGYSMGGRFSLHLALVRPDLVDALVLLGATAGLDTEAERAQRRTDDEALADELERDGLSAFLDRWLALPLFAGIPPERSHRHERLANTAHGLAESLRLAGTGTQIPLWDRLGELEMPVLVVAGGDDEKFTALGQRMVESVGTNATFAPVPGCGHAAHLEDPDAFLDVVRPWLADQDL